MTPIVQIPLANPIHFVKVQQPEDARYHSTGVLLDWYYLQIRDWEEKRAYYQPVQLSDRIRLQFGCTDSANVTLKLLNCDGHPVRSYAPAMAITVPGNVYPYTGQQMYVHYFKFSLDQAAVKPVDPGVYWLVLYGMVDDVVTALEISEPIHVKADHPGTVLIEYYNNSNAYDCIFEQTNCRFALRIKGAVTFDSIDSEDTDYKDQGGKVTKLFGQSGHTMVLSIDQVPPYLLVKINEIMVMDNKKIEGNGYVKDSGAKWELQKTDGAPLKSATIVIRDADPKAATYSITPGPLNLVAVSSYPMAIHYMNFGETTGNIQLLPGGAVLDNDTQRTALIAALNAKVSDLDLFGTFDFSGGYIRYLNASGENYRSVSVFSSTNHVDFNLVTPTFAYSSSLTIGNSLYLVDWGDGAVAAGFAPVAGTTLSHSYLSASTYAMRIFGTFDSLTYQEPAMSGITGKFPSGMKSLSLYGTSNTNGLATFDTNTLSNCEGKIQTLQLSNMKLTSVLNFNLRNFQLLTYLNLYGDKLPAAYINLILANMRTMAANNNIYNGYLTLFGQSPAAAPSAAGAQNKAYLQTSRGWAVTTD